MPGTKDATAQPAQSCTVKMWEDKPCGRPIHPAPKRDQKPVCLMHSKDPEKSDAEFQAEFERILKKGERTKTTADLSEFVFPSSDYSGRTFVPVCCFYKATFTQDADFREATFVRDADFYQATFVQNADFYEATFTEDANFYQATFTQDAYFLGATFVQNAHFDSAMFARDADFTHATFSRRANFSYVILRASVTFRETRFRHDFTAEPGLDFSDVKTEHPEKVEFHTTDLGQALFYNTDVSKVDFTLVSWRERGRVRAFRLRRWLFYWRRLLVVRRRKAWMERWELLARTARRRSPRFCVFDEDVKFEDCGAYALKRLPSSADERNYGLIAETYQQLKRNYDAKGDYWTAGHWHYSEMQMKRLHSRFRSRWARWLNHHCSLVALYKYASAYGESYLMPLAWLVTIIAAFALVYPLTGIELNQSAGGGSLCYWNYLNFFQTHPLEHPAGWWGMILHSLMTSLSVAGFQRELRYIPSYPWGCMLALFELLLTTTLGGLFLLAIRRQFKRS